MKVLVVGSGAREHAIAEAFQKSSKIDKVIISPGNDGIALEFETISLPEFVQIRDFVNANKIDFVFIGPEQPLAEGLTDYLQKHKIRVVGPSQKAARIESSKAFAKEIMQKSNVPTASYRSFTKHDEALKYLQNCSYPQVIKADGLAAGKGVIIVNNLEDAKDAIKEMMLDEVFGNAGNQVVIEEFMVGWETSIFAFTDGENFVSTIFSQDHKAIYDGDKGPNTGGMGAYAPIDKAVSYKEFVDQKVFTPVLKAMRDENSIFRGVLYAGLMITKDGPKVVEFNCRFGDPETQVVLPLLKTDFADVCLAILDNKIEELKLEWKEAYAVNVVAASEGYPGKYRKGDTIKISSDFESNTGAKVYYSGVKKDGASLVTSGGRVCSVTTHADNLVDTITKTYTYFSKIDFTGKTYRSDIGQKGLL